MAIKTKHYSEQLALIAALAVLFGTSAATAQSLDRLSEADANKDGNITWSEVMAMRTGIFERLDRNTDGFVDNKDSPSFGPGKSRFQDAFEKVKSFDANGDGRVSRKELLNAPPTVFAEGDTNGDKILSSKELSALRAKTPQPRQY
ncbi:MAG: EF-hand domain-containing protein [Asticcacaulis sp.]